MTAQHHPHGPVVNQPWSPTTRGMARMRGTRGLAASLLIGVGFATLLPLDSIAQFFADAAVPDFVRKIVGGLLLANGTLMMLPRLAFVATIVPIGLTAAAIVLALGAGALGSVSGVLLLAAAFATLVVLGRIAWFRRPRGLNASGTTPGMDAVRPRHA